MTDLRLEDKVNGRVVLTTSTTHPDFPFYTIVLCRMVENKGCYHKDYRNEEQARKGHEEIVAEVREKPFVYDLREGFQAGMEWAEAERRFSITRCKNIPETLNRIAPQSPQITVYMWPQDPIPLEYVLDGLEADVRFLKSRYEEFRALNENYPINKNVEVRLYKEFAEETEAKIKRVKEELKQE